jgi:predicted ATPase/transcriptional regulator with XRE-family HTH domain
MSVPRSKATFGTLLRAHRLAAGLTQEALAERSGVSPRTIQEVEAGDVYPRRSTALSLAAALDLSDQDRDALMDVAGSRPGRRSLTPGDGPERRDEPAILPPPSSPTGQALREPALVPLPRAAPTNVPWPVSSLLGREADLAAIRNLIIEERQRLVTLTGVGGSGKTRLAIQAATDLLDEFAGGVWFVELGPIADPTLVPQAAAAALGVRELSGAPLLDVLIGFLRPRASALILDNCEHLIEACADLAAQLLAGCPDVAILATSREPLRVAGERQWRVQALAVPDSDRVDSPDELAKCASIRLFVERARAVEPEFALSAANAPAVAQVCARLDGIPLAVELAAARTGVLAVEQIAERLDDCFRLLAGGARAGPARQQTMRATLDWSHDLLDEAERAVFRRLAVFAGGWNLEAAEAIVGDWPSGMGSAGRSPLPDSQHPPSDEVLDLLTQLIDKSLVVVGQAPSVARYRLLEPVRQYARQQLSARGEVDDVRTRHAVWYLTLAERAEPELRGPAQVVWLARLTREQDNLRAALLWAEERGEAETVARLAVALVPFWEVHGSLSEGRRWLDAVLAATNPLPGAPRAKALLGAGRLAFWQVDLEAAATRFEEGLALARELGDRLAVAAAIAWLGAARGAQGAFAVAVPLLEESLALHEALGDESGAAWAQLNLGRAYGNWGAATGSQEVLARAVLPLEASLRRHHALGDVRFGAISATYLGVVLVRLGDRARSVALLTEGLDGIRTVGDHAYLFPSLISLALVAALTEQPVRAARLLGASEAVARTLGTSLAPVNRVTQEEVLAAIRPRLDASELTMARDAGRAMSLDAAMAEAWAVAHDAEAVPRRAAPSPAAAPTDTLTLRERDVRQHSPR